MRKVIVIMLALAMVSCNNGENIDLIEDVMIEVSNEIGQSLEYSCRFTEPTTDIVIYYKSPVSDHIGGKIALLAYESLNANNVSFTTYSVEDKSQNNLGYFSKSNLKDKQLEKNRMKDFISLLLDNKFDKSMNYVDDSISIHDIEQYKEPIEKLVGAISFEGFLRDKVNGVKYVQFLFKVGDTDEIWINLDKEKQLIVGLGLN